MTLTMLKKAKPKVVHTTQFSHLYNVLKQAKLTYWDRVHVILISRGAVAKEAWGGGVLGCWLYSVS